MNRRTLFGLLASTAAASAAPRIPQGYVDLFPKGSLDQWESIGDGIWHILKDGTLVGERPITKTDPTVTWRNDAKAYKDWLHTQAWLYTKRNDFGQFDLHLEYWLRRHGNGGVSIRDTSRAQHAVTTPGDFTRTPSKIGYEIQLNNQYPDSYISGSIYTFVKAKPGVQVDDEWNRLHIESRNELIRVRLNGQVVAEHPGDPKRSKTGPIGLQLHDQYSLTMFRNVAIRELR
jgi:hypothetical protein